MRHADTTLPTLRAERLLLRPLGAHDAPEVRRMAGDPRVAANATGIPYPFELSTATEWIASHGGLYARREQLNLGIETGGELVGAIGLVLDQANRRAELGYWLGPEHWGRGLATEAGRTLIRFGFGRLGLERICANHLGRNPASGRVLEKLGMRFEGRLRAHVRHFGRFEDVCWYGLLREEFLAEQA